MPEFVEHGRMLAAQPLAGSLTVIHGDFYSIDLDGQFDVICYWDGFGIGTDQEQQQLCQRIATWLAPNGCVLLDIGTPWFWAAATGQEIQRGTARRRYDFDADGCRLLDHWWQAEDADTVVTQSIRCYSPADLRLLLHGTGLALEAVEPGGAVDYEHGAFHERVALKQAMDYVAKLVHLS